MPGLYGIFRKIKKISFLLFIFAACFHVWPSPASGEAENGASSSDSVLVDKKGQLQAIESKISENDRMLGEIRSDIEKYKQDYALQKKEYELTKTRLSDNQKKGSELLDAKTSLARELKISTDNLLRKKNLFADRIRAIYKSSFKKKMVMVMESRTFTEFYVNLYYLSRIIKADSEFIADISSKVAAIKKQREELNIKIKELERVNESSTAYEKSLRTTAARIDETLARLHQKEQFLLMQTTNLSSEKGKIEKQIQELETPKPEPAPETREIAMKPEISKPLETAGEKSADISTVNFGWPLKKGRTVLSFYGTQKDPKYNVNYFNPGIDISGAPSEEVVASADGKVKYRGEMKSTGKLLIIDHGGGIKTLYSHLGNIDVGMGQKVKQGDVIGTLDIVGNSNPQPFLHFEIRVDNNTKDPMDHL